MVFRWFLQNTIPETPGFQGPNLPPPQREFLVIQLRCTAMQSAMDVLLDVAATWHCWDEIDEILPFSNENGGG